MNSCHTNDIKPKYNYKIEVPLQDDHPPLCFTTLVFQST